MKRTFIVIIFFIFILSYFSLISLDPSGAEETEDDITRSANQHRTRGSITVDKRGNGDYTSIQQAIDNADNGSTIHVISNGYFESLVINKSLTLIGDQRIPYIYGETTLEVVKINANRVNISGFHFIGASHTENGFTIEGSENIRIFNNSISGNSDGIKIESSNNIKIENNSIYNNIRIGINIISSNNIYIGYNNLKEAIFYTNLVGIKLTKSSNITVDKNTITGCEDYAIMIGDHSTSNSIINNQLSYNDIGVHLTKNVEGTYIFNNNISNIQVRGIQIDEHSENNIVSENILHNASTAVSITRYSNNNIIAGNHITENWIGIMLNDRSNNNSIEKNVISFYNYDFPDRKDIGYDCGIEIYNSKNSTINGNVLYNTGIYITGYRASEFNTHSISKSNLVNNKPVYYYKDLRNFDIDGIEAGQVIITNCTNVNISNLEITNTGYGIQLGFTNNSRVSGNFLARNYKGINLHNSHYNIVTRNGLTRNAYGIDIEYASSYNIIAENDLIQNYGYGVSIWNALNNTIFHNNFVANTYPDFKYGEDQHDEQTEERQDDGLTDWQSVSQWDNGYTHGGNYWSDYYGKDEFKGEYIAYQKQTIPGSDGYGDERYNLDRYPLMAPVNDLIEQIQGNIKLEIMLDSAQYDENENISGNINVKNNNYFDAYSHDPFRSYINNISIEIESLNRNNSYSYRIDKRSKFEKESITVMDFSFPDSLYGGLKSIPLDLPPGQYRMHTIMTIYLDSYFFTELNSSTFDFEITSKFPAADRIDIMIQLSKHEYFSNEPITGTIKILNNNSVDITFNRTGQYVLGMHFEFNSITGDEKYYGINVEDLYPIHITAYDSIVLNFRIENKIIEPADAVNVRYIDLPDGNYTIKTFLSLEQPTGYVTIYSNDEKIMIKSNKTSSDEEQPGSTSLQISWVYLIAISIVFVVAGSSIFISATEVGKYGFFSAVGPMYTKQRKKRGEKYGYLKGSVRGYIVGNPGQNYNSIKRELDLPNGTLAYYLKVLEREGIVRSERDGTLKRFYPADGRITTDVLELTEIQQNIYDEIMVNPGVSQKDVQEKLGISQQRLNYQIKQMAEARLIRVEREGKRTRCYIIDNI